MTQNVRQSAGLPHGWVTLMLTLLFVLVFRLEQNAAYVLGISTRELVGLDVAPIWVVTRVLAPLVHANATHLVGTLVWFIPFGYFLERRTRWESYVGFVVLAGVLSTTVVPAVFAVSGTATSVAFGASGITHALVGREATARSIWVVERRSLSRRQRAILLVALVGLSLKLLSFSSSPPPGTSVVGHATGLLVGILVGIGERYVGVSVA